LRSIGYCGPLAAIFSKERIMNLGEFSVSLNITDMDKSLAFYNALGFEQVAGEYEQNWVILAHGGAVIGLFHGMFEENLMTFNPEDARAIQAALIEQGIEILTGIPAGSRDMNGNFPDGTVYGSVQKKLGKYMNQALKFKNTEKFGI
jgi:catechol 2,3-dioxygenase-like lactoylglutathione lyase family enzyme